MQDFIFIPRTEAHSMRWDELLPPLQHAVRDLLIHLDGAVKEADQHHADYDKSKIEHSLASCFLVYGGRGTGKTTVLLSAKDAVNKNSSNFFVHSKANKDDTLRQDAETSAGELIKKGVIWLDVLDIESMPPHTNLLTTLLIRVRNSLDMDGFKSNTRETSILEEGTDSARQQLDQLIKDATVMWEDIHEHTTREISSRQIYAVETYADFKRRFREAMKKLCEELGRRNGRNDGYHPIILPIDNIDRSTEHLYNIVKLAQMVDSPNLWLILAGDREDIETFLERAYWKELISMDMGGGGIGKKALGDEDEALVMARRQASAASHKLLPPSHRIEVNLVKPGETLNFCASSNNDSNKHTIYDLLEIITLPNFGYGHEITFVELFDAKEHVVCDTNTHQNKTVMIEINDTKSNSEILIVELTKKQKNELDKKHLTQSARTGLQLPARCVLDLWQLAYWAVNDNKNDDEKNESLRAEKVARTMLRNLISESNVSSKTGQMLQNKIIGRNFDGATILNFHEPNPYLNISYLQALEAEFRLGSQALPANKQIVYSVKSSLSVRGEPSLVIFSLEDNIVNKNIANKIHDDINNELPPLVGGWLSILYDIVLYSKKSWVRNARSTKIYLPLVSTMHKVSRTCFKDKKTSVTLFWPMPDWIILLEYDIFRQRWGNFKTGIFNKLSTNEFDRNDRFQLTLAVGWISCVIDTFHAFSPYGWVDKHGEMQESEWLAATILKSSNWSNDGICADEDRVMKAAADLYSRIMNNDANHERVILNKEGVIFMRDWLEQKLPLLLSHLYVPMNDTNSSKRLNRVMKYLEGTQLAMYWKNNWVFMLADIEKDLAEVFGVEPKTSAENSASRRADYLKNMGSFADMHHFFKKGD
jgi:hypothetical protein